MADEKEAVKTQEAWRQILETGREYADLGRIRHILRHIPKAPRCRVCNSPFEGLGGALVKLILGKAPSTVNPLICNDCEVFARKHPGGAEVDLAMLFADIRGSTGLAETLGDARFRGLIDHFYRLATDVLVHKDALIEKLAGDEVSALFVPGFAGEHYTEKAIDAAAALLEATGARHIPIGIGVHKGRAFVGSVGTQGGMVAFAALGDAVNTAARLASVAGAGELLVSDEAMEHAAMGVEGFEQRTLTLKGRTAPISVRVLRAAD
jgi:adenylate cyclase